MALDLGEKYSGIAISDPGRSLARPLEVVASERIVEYLDKLFLEESILEVLVGVPRTLGGEVGFQAGQVLRQLDVLRDAFPHARFVEWDERFTTRVAKGRPGRSRKRRVQERVDHLAAAGMLQEYLDRRGTLEMAREEA